MNLILDNGMNIQPREYIPNSRELHVAISSLSLGGAERIVLDWAHRIYPRYKVHLIVLRNREKEWPVPSFVRVTRLGGSNLRQQLITIGEEIMKSPNPVCTCHLLSTSERRALASAGATVVPVFHNASAGWQEGASFIGDAPYAIAVSEACRSDLSQEGWKGASVVIRHIPGMNDLDLYDRALIHRVWNIPQGAVVVGMLGAIKPQKNYPLALRLFKKLLEREPNAYLVIIGGPVNTHLGRDTWNDIVQQVTDLGIRHRVAMPGFIPNATQYLRAYDCLLNTSLYEGLSIATLEALLMQIPVVASKVGGQGEIPHDSLFLLPLESEENEWVDALSVALQKKCKKPHWADFPSFRLWTLASIVRPVQASSKTLFVTANLSSGGAQRSLVNLVKELQERIDLEVMVAGKSSITYFLDDLVQSGVHVWSAGYKWNAFDYAETIAEKIVNEGFGTVCFWNVDARIKLLLTKMFAFSNLRIVDVSPGGYLFAEMDETRDFQELVAFGSHQYMQRIDSFVHKYQTNAPEGCKGKTFIIQNGVPESQRYIKDYSLRGNPRIVVSGRIAPTKFLLEIVEAMHILWMDIPLAEIHIVGAAEKYHQEYLDSLVRRAGKDIGTRIKFHGSNPCVAEILPDFDAYIVLGKDQGCPNALLEAFAAGLPVVGNDDGGTREQIIHGITGLLISEPKPILIAEALKKLLLDRALAQRLGEKGRSHVMEKFSMERMVHAYGELFDLSGKESVVKATR